MPCNSDYMKASNYEVEISRVACLLDELRGFPFKKIHWNGYHPDVYCQHVVDGDKLTRELCEKLQNIDVTEYSLEMQIWWRDHQRADEERIRKEIERQQTESDKQKALSKLSSYERRILGLEG